MSQKTTLAASAILAVGLASAGFFIGGALSDIRNGAQLVSVRGLAEKEVKADYVNWPLTFTASGEDLAKVQLAMQASQSKLVAFLTQAGLTAETDFRFTPWQVTDSRARDYSGNPSADRYIMSATVQISTPQVDKVTEAARNISSLLSEGVLIGNNNLSYILSNINDEKPDLIAEATKQARRSAEQFAKDSDAKVGGISRASQGSLSIRVRGQDYDDQTQPNKILRVVTSIDYLLEK